MSRPPFSNRLQRSKSAVSAANATFPVYTIVPIYFFFCINAAGHGNRITRLANARWDLNANTLLGRDVQRAGKAAA